MATNDLEKYDQRSNGVAEAIQALASGKATVFSSIVGDDFDTKLAVLEATTESLPLADNLGKRIDLVNVVVQSIEMPDEQTGEVVDVPRTILIDADGTAYHAISQGVFRALENIIGVLGQPQNWPDGGVAVKVLKEGTGTRQYFTIKSAKADKK